MNDGTGPWEALASKNYSSKKPEDMASWLAVSFSYLSINLKLKKGIRAIQKTKNHHKIHITKIYIPAIYNSPWNTYHYHYISPQYTYHHNVHITMIHIYPKCTYLHNIHRNLHNTTIHDNHNIQGVKKTERCFCLISRLSEWLENWI